MVLWVIQGDQAHRKLGEAVGGRWEFYRGPSNLERVALSRRRKARRECIDSSRRKNCEKGDCLSSSGSKHDGGLLVLEELACK
jgi:hypothetical protein